MALLAWAWVFTLPGLVLTALGVPANRKHAGYASLAGPFVLLRGRGRGAGPGRQRRGAARQLAAVPARRRLPSAGRRAQRAHAGHPRPGRRAGVRLLARLHGRRPWSPTILRLPGPVRGLDGAAGPGRQPGRAAHRLDRCRHLQLPADLVLARQARHARCWPASPGRQRYRRRCAVAGGVDRADRLRRPGHAGHAAVLERRWRRRAAGAAAVRRRRRQVGPGSAVLLAAQRHGRPDAHQRAHPRRDDGRRGRVPAGADARAAGARAAGQRGGGHRRRRDRAGGQPGQHLPVQFQEGHRVFDRRPAWLHVRRRLALARRSPDCSTCLPTPRSRRCCFWRRAS